MEIGEKYFHSDFKNNFHLNLLDLSDGILRTEDGCTFPIHKFVLAKNSKYFYVLFCGMGKDKDDILIPGIKGKVLSNILTYLYTGNIHVTEENIYDLIIASDYLLLNDLLSRIKSLLRWNLTFTNSLSIFEAGFKINTVDISSESFRYVQTHFESIVYCVDSQIWELPLDAFKFLLSDKNLCIMSERTVWLAITIWVEADTLNRLSWVHDLLMHLRICDVDENTADEILQHEIVANNPSCQEILNIKARFCDENNLNILLYYFQNYASPMFTLYDHRQPTMLHYIVQYNADIDTEVIQIYLTYDENIDLWRRVFEIDIKPEILLLLNGFIYMLSTYEDVNLRFNIIEKQSNELRNFRTARYNYDAVVLDGLIYVLGGICELTDEIIYDVEVYDPEADEWNIATPMIPVSSFNAISHNHFIYVIGSKFSFTGYQRVFQVYDPVLNTWNALPLFPSPLIIENFAMVEYQDMIYVIGGLDGDEYLKYVKVFDPRKNEWSDEADIPFSYRAPKAIVFNDKLIVYDNDNIEGRNYLKYQPTVEWNAERKCWETFEESSSMNNLHMYCFLKLENKEFLDIILRENRDPATHFESSPFD